jgi:MoxR-like ATPase
MVQEPDDTQLLARLQEDLSEVTQRLQSVIVGQQEVIDDLLACFFSGGHALLVGVPGLAKTMMVRALARTLDLEFNRVQFTPDLMPADITGADVLYEDKHTGERSFRFIKGPIFANIVLADEINRAPPKTQSALLQAMQEYEVTASGTTYALPAPFWLLATQNPIEQEGTYPLPEAQQDRFEFSIEMGYPSFEDECFIARHFTGHKVDEITPQLDSATLRRYRELIGRIPVADSVVDYAVRLIRMSRPSEEACPDTVRPYCMWGAGPRASQYLLLAARAYAALQARATPDITDVQRAAYPVLRHRLVRSFHADTEGVSANELVKRIIEAAG